MQVKVVYNKGQLELPPGIVLSRDVFHVQVEIPAAVIHTSGEGKRGKGSEAEIRSRPYNIRRLIDAILGRKSRETPDKGLNTRDYKQLWHEHLNEKHRGNGANEARQET